MPGTLGLAHATDDPQHAQARESRAERLRIEAEARQRRRTLTRYEDVGVVQQQAHSLSPVVVLQVQSLDRNAGVHLGVPRRRELEQWIAGGRLDLDHARPGLLHPHRRQRARYVLRHRDDQYAIEQFGRVHCSSR